MNEEIMNENMESEQPKEPPRFETRTTYTKAVCRESHFAIMRGVEIGIGVAFFVIVLFWVKDFIEFGRLPIEDIFLMFLEIALGIFFIFLSNKRENRKHRDNSDGNKEKIPIIHKAFCESEIILTDENSGEETHYDYADIKRLLRTKNLYVLVIPKTRGLLVERGGFLKGDAASFEAFLVEKCPQAKRNFLKGKNNHK